MFRKLIVVMCLALVGQNVYADSLNIQLSDESARLIYAAEVFGGQFGPTDLEVGAYFNEDDDTVAHVKVVGPAKQAAMLEGSKSFAKAFMEKYQIGQVVRDDGPETHLSKEGVPTMGGLFILIISPVLPVRFIIEVHLCRKVIAFPVE